MLGGIGAFIAGEISGAVRRNVTVAVLMGLGVLLMLCAGGYLVAAVHTALALRYGSVEASLVVAGGLFVLPSLFILIALSWIYLAFGDTPLVAGLFYGIKPAVTALVLQAAQGQAHAWAWAWWPRPGCGSGCCC